jgi:hypothetical protein
MKTKFGLLCLFVIASMLLTACEIGITTKINSDGSGEMNAIFKFEKTEVEGLSAMGLGSADELCSSMTSSDTTGVASEDMEFVQEDHDGAIWCVASKAFASLDEITESDSGLSVTTAEIKDGKFTLEADFEMGEDMDTSSLGMLEGYTVSMYYDLVAPGKIDKAKSTGWDEINGNTARLVLLRLNDKDESKEDVTKTGNIHITLESDTKGGGGASGDNALNKKYGGVPLWGFGVALCCCLLLIVIIVVVVFFVIKKKPKQPVQ